MKISTILDHIDSGHMALPEFQRGYVWNRDQVRGLFDSLYRRHPVGGLLVWATESMGATHRGDGVLAPGIVKLLLDGQPYGTPNASGAFLLSNIDRGDHCLVVQVLQGAQVVQSSAPMIFTVQRVHIGNKPKPL